MREQSKLRMCSALYISQYREANEDWRGTFSIFELMFECLSFYLFPHTYSSGYLLWFSTVRGIRWKSGRRTFVFAIVLLSFDLLVYMCTSSCNNCTFFVPNCEVNFAVQGKWGKGRRGGALEPFPFPPNQATYPSHPSLSHFRMSELQPADWELFHGEYITNIQMNYIAI